MNEKKSAKKPLVHLERIENRILFVRKHKVMIDADLARIYGVSTKRLNEQVKRNIDRFPKDFMFKLTNQELRTLRSQFATPKLKRRHEPPYVFTEHGAIMLASVLNTPIAINAGIQVVRAFIKLREILATHKQLAAKLEEMEKKYDTQFKEVFQVLRQLMKPSKKDHRQIGFNPKK